MVAPPNAMAVNGHTFDQLVPKSDTVCVSLRGEVSYRTLFEFDWSNLREEKG